MEEGVEKQKYQNGLFTTKHRRKVGPSCLGFCKQLEVEMVPVSRVSNAIEQGKIPLIFQVDIRDMRFSRRGVCVMYMRVLNWTHNDFTDNKALVTTRDFDVLTRQKRVTLRSN